VELSLSSCVVIFGLEAEGSELNVAFQEVGAALRGRRVNVVLATVPDNDQEIVINSNNGR
jgi:hypothetical protein